MAALVEQEPGSGLVARRVEALDQAVSHLRAEYGGAPSRCPAILPMPPKIPRLSRAPPLRSDPSTSWSQRGATWVRRRWTSAGRRRLAKVINLNLTATFPRYAEVG
jgi:hypothetical protein